MKDRILEKRDPRRDAGGRGTYNSGVVAKLEQPARTMSYALSLSLPPSRDKLSLAACKNRGHRRPIIKGGVAAAAVEVLSITRLMA